MSDLWSRITNRVNAEHPFMSGVDRSAARIEASQEYFTPTEVIIQALQALPIDQLGLGKHFIDPSCGDAQSLVAVKWLKILYHHMTEAEALEDLYGVDIMRDNVDLTIKRLGGGHIIMGDFLNPTVRLFDQTEFEHKQMIEWFGQASLTNFEE